MPTSSLTTFISAHIPVSPQVRSTIAGYFEEREIGKQEYFVKEGKVSHDYLYLEEGLMRAFTHDNEGNEVTTYFYGSNRVVFEVSSFFMRAPATENIQAVTDCKGYAITYDKLNMLFHSVPEFREFGRAMLVKEFAAFKVRTLGLINKSAEERYASLISASPELFRHAQLRHIASYLGITDTSLSRIRKELSKK